ncbi:MAG: MotA/TolQ/ExbB proton channel family protein [Elusimicrobia bacterium]|jgi:biopolymer transport protein ExbB|nr:MotA/TolQ/ExbB proton channel family protein [Elusimicrobiota bacterium]MBR4631985.1 MotA/TolQ/ExbB proton channel family protein [Elusimicrobiota bacterium]
MFAGKSFFEILAIGGWTLYLLLFISILSISVIILKIIEFSRKSNIDITELLKRTKNTLVKKGNIEGFIGYCLLLDCPVSNIIAAGLKKYMETGNPDIEQAMKRKISIEVLKLERYTTILATVGAVSVYIGLFGTVLGIIRSFHDISLAGSGGISVVIGGVSESLIATAAGLSVAIPAVVAFNFLSRSVDKFVIEMEYVVSALKEIMSELGNK